jgi:hypothetical protein
MKTSPTRHVFGLFALLCFLLPGLQGQVIWSEDFETNGEGTRYLSPHLFFDPTSNDDYWGRIEGELMLYADPPSPGSSIALVGTGAPNNQLGEYTGYNGGFYFAGEDLDDAGGQGNPDDQDEKELLVTGIDISDQSNLWFKGLFAAGAMTGCGASTYDSDDYVKVFYSVDGGPYILGLCFNADLYCNNPGATNNQPIHYDPDCDGDGGEGTMLVNAFQEFSFPVPNGSILNLKLVVHADDNGEEMAFDYLRIEGVSGPTCVDPVISGVEKSGDSCQPGDPVTLTVSGVLNDADDWYWYADGCGQTAAGTGASITVNPAQTTTYHVRGEPGCDGPLPCATITVNVGTDVTPPTISCPSGQEVAGDANCSAVLADYSGQAVVEDDCDTQPTVSQSPAPGTAFTNLLTVTLTAEDGSGNSSACTFNVQVTDNEAPSLTIPADVTLECDEPVTPPAATCGPLVILKPGLVISLPASGSVSLNAADFDAGSVDACGSGGLTFSFSPNTGNTSKVYNCNNTGTHPVTIWATDDDGNQHSATSSIIVQDPESYCANGGSGCQPVPVLYAALRAHLQPDGEVTLSADEWDAGSKNTCQSGNLTFSFSSNTNDQTRTFDCAQTGNQSVEIWVTDGSGNQARATATLVVQDQAAYCDAPSANCRARALLLDGLVVNLGPQRSANIPASLLNAGSSDDCGTGGLTFAFDDPIPSPFKVYTCDDIGTQIEQIRVIDGNGAFELLEVVITVMDRESSCEGVGFATASDNCDPEPSLTWSDQTAPGECPVVEIITRTWTATDDAGNSVSATQLITIQDTTPPEVVCPDDQTGTLGPDCAFAVPDFTGLVSAGDNCSLNLSVSQMPAAGAVLNASATIVIEVTDDCENTTSCTFQLTLNDEIDPVVECPSNQEVLPTGNCVYTLEDYTSLAAASDNCDAEPALSQIPAPGAALNGTTTVSITATDAAGNSSVCTFEVNLISLPPVFNLLPSDITVSCESDVPGKQDVEAFDDCDGEVQVIFSQTGLPLSCPGMGTVVNTWTATDSHGNSIAHTQTVTVMDQTDPELTSYPADITVTCLADVPGNQGVMGVDNCGETLTPVFIQSSPPACSGSGTMTNTWLVQDCAGNSVVHVQTVTILDQEGPEFDFLPQAITVSCADEVPGSQNVTATDNCGGPVTVVFSQSDLPPCPGLGAVVNTWTATDCAGNSSAHTQLVTIFDNMAPVLSAYPLPLIVTCIDDVPGDPGITATDNCSGPVDVAFSQTINVNCPGSGTVTNIWTATDCAGNMEMYAQVVTIDDNTPPVLSAQPAPVTVSCLSDVPGDPGITATDNCGGVVDVTFQQIVNGNCPGSGTVTNTWTATDCAGNSSVYSQLVTIADNAPPVLSALPQNLTVACEDAIPGAQGITASDNCGGGLTVVFTQTGLPLSYPNPGQVVNTWTVTDCAGNSTSHSQFITIEDNEAPDAVCQNATIQISLNGQAILTPSMIDGGSSDNCGIASWSLDQTTFTCDEIGVYPVELTIADLFENEASCTALVNVVASFDCPAPGLSYLGGPNVSDPCSCLGNGLFEEEVVVGPTGPGQIWTVVSTTLLDPNTMQPYPAGTVLTEYDQGGGESIYALMGVHLDGVGYDIEVASPSFPGLSLTLSNVCYYPEPQIIGLDGPFCIYSDPVTLEGDVNGVTLVSEVFTIDGTPATVFDPFDLGVGNYEVVYTVDAGTAAPGNPLDPGCVASATQFVQVLQTPASLACNNLVTVAVDGDCEALITPDMILEGTYLCYDDYSVTVKKGVNTLPNPVPGSYIGQTLTATVKHLPSGNSCTGLLILEDNLPPAFDCSASPVQINCSDDLSAVPPPVATDNCTSETVQMVDELYVDTDPCGDNTVVLHRIWVAVDNYGNESATCLQVIEIIRPDDIDFPNDIVWDCTQYAEFGGITAAASLHPVVLGLQSGIAPIDASGLADPAVLGNTGSGIPEGLQGSFCDYSFTYTDQVLNDCGNTFTIVRTWTVIDGCTGQIITGNAAGEDNVQIISIVDQTPPQIVRPPFEVTAAIPGAHPLPCTSEGYLLPATVTDDCSSWTVRIFTPVGEAIYLNGQNGSEGGFIPAPGLPLGVHTIVYQATDACNNVQELPVAVTVVDNISPVAICDEITTVTLSSNGKAVVPAGVFDDGSYDNCCMDFFEVRRMEDACGIPGNTSFGPSVTFCCEDVGPDPVSVVFRVYDCFGNYNECMVQVIVEDKLPPISVFCPPNQTITCEYYQDQLAAGLAQGDYSVLDPFGIPLFFDNCGLEVTQTVTSNLNTCTEGTITRQWTAVDPFGNAPANCTQVINVEHVSNWVVEFPADITATCNDASLPPFGEPEIFFDDCELVGTSFDDQEFTVSNGSCYMIVRTWTVINWCLYDDYGYNAFTELSEAQANLDFDGDGDKDGRTFKDGVNNGSGPDGYIVYNQTITVVDNEAPIFQVSDLDICILETDCNTNVTLLVPFVEDCSDDITVSVTTNLPNGNGFGPYLNVPPGVYTATYAVSDGCNNTAYQEIEIVVEDCLNPTPLCDNGLVVEIMQSGMISIEAEAFDEGSWDNCGGPLQFSFSADVNDVTRFYTCDDLGEQAVEIWVTDANGNQDFCATFIEVQDNMNFCSTIQTVNVAGAIQVENGNPVSNVMVDVNSGLASMTTSFTGMFDFELPSGNDYTITPMLNLFPANGVTTLDMILIQKHILGLLPLNSPYKIIAADANKSGSVTTVDLIAIQKIILVLLPNFPNNTSWRFVDKDYVFPNPQNPWQTGSFPEVISYNDLSTDQLFTDFVAVKVGDVNLSAQTGSLLEEGQERELAGILELVADEQELTRGETFTLTLRVKPAEILGYQFTLDFEKEAIEWLDLAPGLVPEDHFGWALADEGAITTNWYAAETTWLDEETVLFQLTGRARKDGRLSDWLRISSRFTPAEAYNAAGEQLEVRLLFEGALQQSDGFVLHQNWPNPFRHSTRIGFELPEAGSARLTVLDAAGQVLQVVDGSYPKGYNEIQLGQLRVSGVLYYKLETPTHMAVRKMVAME